MHIKIPPETTYRMYVLFVTAILHWHCQLMCWCQRIWFLSQIHIT